MAGSPMCTGRTGSTENKIKSKLNGIIFGYLVFLYYICSVKQQQYGYNRENNGKSKGDIHEIRKGMWK